MENKGRSFGENSFTDYEHLIEVMSSCMLSSDTLSKAGRLYNDIKQLEKKIEALEGLVNEVLRYQSWSDINKNHITVFQAKLKQIQEGK